MEGAEVRKLAELEGTHWWYRERGICCAAVDPTRARVAPATSVRRVAGTPGCFVGRMAATRSSTARRGRGRARAWPATVPRRRHVAPFADKSLDLVVSFDVLEHLQDDHGAVAELHRVLKPTGTLLVAVPADPKLWSDHDVAVDHVRRYTRQGLIEVLDSGGFDIVSCKSWNVLLRPVVALRRRTGKGSDLTELGPVVNFALRAVVTPSDTCRRHPLPGSACSFAQPRAPDSPSSSAALLGGDDVLVVGRRR